MEVGTIFSFVATICSCFLFASPLSEVHSCYASKSTKGQSPVPFVCIWLSCCLWILYGIKIVAVVVIFVNVIGCALSMYYIFLWTQITHGTEKVQLYLLLLGAGGFIVWATLYTHAIVGPFGETDYLPWIATIVTVLMFASPLIVMGKVIKNKNSAFLNFRLTTMTIANCCAWTGIGLLRNDLFISVPNILGLLLALVQLSLVIKYPAKQIIVNNPSFPI